MKHESLSLYFSIIIIFFFMFTILGTIYLVGLYLDWKVDERVCEKDIERDLYVFYSHLECFANEDSDKYNFGKGQYCVCFWYDENLKLQSTEFLRK